MSIVRMIIPILTLGLNAVAFGEGTPASDDERTSGLHLNVLWQDEAGEEKVDGCETFYLHLLEGRGLYGMGLFNSAKCQMGKSLMTLPKDWSWLIVLKIDEDRISVRFSRKRENMKPYTLLRKEYLLAKGNAQKIRNGDFNLTRLIASAILFDLPWQRHLTKEDLATKQFAFNSEPLLSQMLTSPPTQLWLRGVNKKSLKVSKGKSTWHVETRGKTSQWSLKGRSKSIDTASSFAFGQIPRRKRIVIELERQLLRRHSLSELAAEDLSSSIDDIEKQFLDGIASGFIGYEYGLSLIADQRSPLSAATVHSLFGEFRSGFAEGLRIYYDAIPAAKVIVDGEEQFLKLTRLSIGNGIARSFLSGLLRLEFRPKLGRYDAHAVLLTKEPEPQGELAATEIRVEGCPALGLDLGLELNFKVLAVSGWYSRDITDKVYGRSLRQAVISQKAAVKLFVPGPGFSVGQTQIKLGLHASANSERIQLTSEDREASGEIIPFALTVNFVYATFGLSIAWQ